MGCQVMLTDLSRIKGVGALFSDLFQCTVPEVSRILGVSFQLSNVLCISTSRHDLAGL